jgi:hypothetical protein
MNVRNLVACSALALASAGALATTYNIGSLPLAPLIYSNTASLPFSLVPFTDQYNFVFPLTGAGASGSAVSVSVAGLLNINTIQVALFTSGGAGLGSGGAGFASSLSNIALTPGASYYYTVTGVANGAAGGAYSFIASAAPVPEPETYGLMLAGLGVVVFLAARRAR